MGSVNDKPQRKDWLTTIEQVCARWFLPLLVITFVGVVAMCLPALAQTTAQSFPNLNFNMSTGGGKPSDAANFIQIVLLLTILTMAPSLLVMVTSFPRIIIILSLLRNALGTQQSPPNSVLIGLALFLTMFIMAPTFKTAYETAWVPYTTDKINYEEFMVKVQKPFRGFMLKQVYKKDLQLFVNMAQLEKKPKTVEDVPTYVVIPAYMTSELYTAFRIGFFVFLPFLVIDLVVSSILMSMGMLMLPPVLISLPFKLLLFVLIDGFNLLFGSIVQSFRKGPV